MRLIKVLSLIVAVGLMGVIGYVLLAETEEQIWVSPLPEIFQTSVKLPPSQFSLKEAPSESREGMIATFSGEVRYLGRTATVAAAISGEGQAVRQGENYITGAESNLNINFGEVVKILIEEKTEVDVIQTLPDRLIFSQVEGKATYTVREKVTVRTAYLLTQFVGVVRIARDAKTSVVEVTVASGSAVAAYNDLDYQSHTVTAEAGQVLRFNYDTRRMVLE